MLISNTSAGSNGAGNWVGSNGANNWVVNNGANNWPDSDGAYPPEINIPPEMPTSYPSAENFDGAASALNSDPFPNKPLALDHVVGIHPVHFIAICKMLGTHVGASNHIHN